MSASDYDAIAEIADVFAYGKVDAVKRLVSEGVSLDEELRMGETPFGVAVRFSNYAVVDYLLGIGADVNKCYPDRGGEPPVKVAYDQGDKRMYDILVEAGGDLDLPGWMGISVRDRLASLPRSTTG